VLWYFAYLPLSFVLAFCFICGTERKYCIGDGPDVEPGILNTVDFHNQVPNLKLVPPERLMFNVESVEHTPQNDPELLESDNVTCAIATLPRDILSTILCEYFLCVSEGHRPSILLMLVCKQWKGLVFLCLWFQIANVLILTLFYQTPLCIIISFGKQFTVHCRRGEILNLCIPNRGIRQAKQKRDFSFKSLICVISFAKSESC
jgi:hypothetical protein